MIKTTSWTGGTDEEYETQHFGFGAQRLKIAVRQMVEQKIQNGVKDMEAYLQESLELNDKDKFTLRHSCENLIRLYCERAGTSLNIIDKEIERLLKIPHNVLLLEDEVQHNPTSDEDYKKLKEEVLALRKRVERGALVESLLIAEEEELSSAEKICDIAKKDMEVLDLIEKKLDGNDSTKTVQSEVNFLCASVPFIQNNDANSIFEE